MNRFIQIGLADFRLIFRDPSLRIFLLMPGMIFIVVLLVIPNLINTYPIVENYAAVILMGGYDAIKCHVRFYIQYGLDT